MNHKKTETDKDILKTLIATVPTTLTMFAKEIGVNPASLRNVAAGRTDLSEKVKCKIIQKYPNTNREFLDFGIGDVFLESKIDHKIDLLNEKIDFLMLNINNLTYLLCNKKAV